MDNLKHDYEESFGCQEFWMFTLVCLLGIKFVENYSEKCISKSDKNWRNKGEDRSINDYQIIFNFFSSVIIFNLMKKLRKNKYPSTILVNKILRN